MCIFIPAWDDRLYHYVIANDVITLGHKRTDEPFFFNRFIETNCPKEPVCGKEPDFPSLQLIAFAVLLLAVIKQHCITAGTPFLIGGELPVFVVRPHAPNRDVRTVKVRYEYMYRSTPNTYIFP